MAIFMPAYNPKAWRPVIATETNFKDRALPDVSPAEQAEMQRHNAAIDRRVAELRSRLDELNRRSSDRLIAAHAASLPAPIRADVTAAIRLPAAKRDAVQKYLAAKFEPSLTIKPEELPAAMNAEEKEKARLMKAEIEQVEAKRKTCSKIQALYDIGPRRRLTSWFGEAS